jgi:hypothetical protein
MGMLKVVVLTSNAYLWAIKPFAYLFNVYWSEQQPVVVCGYARPDFDLPNNFEFFAIGRYNYPAKIWTNGLLRVLDYIKDDHFVLMLEDYWLCRTVDVRGVMACYDYIKDRPEVLRIDLTDDRLYAGGRFDVESYGSYDIIETPTGTPYQTSTQAGIWNKTLMAQIVKPEKSAWEFEIHTSPPENMRVLGSRQMPVRYANAILKGELQNNEVERIPEPHRSKVVGWIPRNMKND